MLSATKLHIAVTILLLALLILPSIAFLNAEAANPFLDLPDGTIITIVGDGFQNADGSGRFSGDGGLAVNASLYFPQGIALGKSGNLFLVDAGNRRIRRVDAASGIITTVAGNGNVGFIGDGGPATNAVLFPGDVALDGAGNLFISDSGNFRIRHVDAASGIITTVAGNGSLGFSGDGGPATSASLRSPAGLAVDGAGNLFFADSGNARVRRVDASTGIITTVAGNGTFGSCPGLVPCGCPGMPFCGAIIGDGGPAIKARVNPIGVAIDKVGNLFLTDIEGVGDGRIRRVDAQNGIITTVAGGGTAIPGDGGPATSATLSLPFDVALDSTGNLFIAEGSIIRRVDARTGIITTVAGGGKCTPNVSLCGDGGPATSAHLNRAMNVMVDVSGNLIISDTGNNVVRLVKGIAGSNSSGDFVLSINPVSQTISAGASTSFTVSVQALGSFIQPVSLSAAVTPPDSSVTTNFSSSSVNPGSSATLTVNTAVDTPPNTFTIAITGTAGQLVHTTTATLTVMAVPDFTLSFNLSTMNVTRGQSGFITVGINRTGGFAGNVTVTAPDTKPIKIKLTPPVQSTTGTSLSFNFKVKLKAPVGTQQLNFTGRDDTGRTRSAIITLNIQ